MKKIYQHPAIKVARIAQEALLAAESGGEIDSGFAKEDDFEDEESDFGFETEF